jgi:hypothetical protein
MHYDIQRGQDEAYTRHNSTPILIDHKTYPRP